MIPLGALAFFRGRDGRPHVGNVTMISAHGYISMETPTIRATLGPSEAVVPINDAKAALMRAARLHGTASIPALHAEALVAYIRYLEAGDAPATTPHARSEGAAGAVPGAGR